jgi:serine/threonine-protein kinase
MRGESATSATMVTRPRTTPPAPPVYRPPGAYYEERPRRSIWPWILGLLALAIAGATGYLLYEKIQDQLNENRPVTVADVGQLKQPLAVKQLEDQGFQVHVVKVASRTVESGSVIRQDPPGGEPRPKGSTVTLYVSTGIPKSTVPGVVGLSQTDAITALVHAGLNARTVYVYSDKPNGTVTGQAPGQGAVVFTGSKVRINVSQGERTASVPSVVGQPYANAASALQGGGFVVVRVDADSDQPKGTVIAQDPPGGATVGLNSRVTITVSKGPVTASVPSVTGDTQADAEQLLTDAGFKTTVETQDVTDPSQDGLVLATDPAPGTTAEQGSTVTLFVGKLVTTPVETVPTDTTGATTDTTTTAITTTTTTAGPTSQTPP